MKYLRIMLPLVFLAGCQTLTPDARFVGSVEVFGDKTKNIQIKLSDKTKQDIEMFTHANALLDELQSIGWVRDPNSNIEMDLVAKVETRSNVGSMPTYGVVGYADPMVRGYVYRDSFIANSYSAPVYGVTGSRSFRYETYVRRLTVSLKDVQQNVPVLKINVSTEGEANTISEVMSPLAHMIELAIETGETAGTVSFDCFEQENLGKASNSERYKDKRFDVVDYKGVNYQCAPTPNE